MQLTKPISMPSLSLGRKKPGGLAGLNIEAGSIAVAEVSSNGSTHVAASAVQPLQPGVFHEGEVINPDGLIAALEGLYSSHKLPKRVRVGVGNQRVIVRTLRLPAIEDPEGDGGGYPLPGPGADPDAAGTRGARAPGGRRCSRPGGDGAPGRRRCHRRAAGHDQLLRRTAASGRARTGGTRPLRVRDDPGPRATIGSRRPDRRRGRRRARRRDPLLQRRRRPQSRLRPRPLLPLHEGLRHRHGGDRRPPLHRAWPPPRTRRAVAAPRRPRSSRWIRSEATPRSLAPPGAR